MKESMYNIKLMDGSDFLIFNSLKKTYVKTSKNAALVQEILKHPEEYKKSNIEAKLIELGFITENEDERAAAEFQFWESVYDGTLNLCIMPTEQCNFRCVYCYEKFQVGTLSEENIKGLLTWIKRNIGNYRGVHINWFGGEPLLAFGKICELSERMIEICRVHHKHYAASITTNGYLLSEDVFRKLMRYKVLQYHITIDGNRENHDRQRILRDGKPTYDVIMRNLKNIKKNIKSKMFSIIIRTNVSTNMLSGLYDFIGEMYQEFGSDERFGFYFRPVGKWENSEFGMNETDLITNIDEMYELMLSAKHNLNYKSYQHSLEQQMCFVQKRNQFVIRGDGRIIKCTMLLEHPENEVGTITATGVCIDEKKLVRWLDLSHKEEEKCSRCGLYASCFSKACPAKRHILKEKKLCGYEGKSVTFILKLLNKSNVFYNLDEENEYGC